MASAGGENQTLEQWVLEWKAKAQYVVDSLEEAVQHLFDVKIPFHTAQEPDRMYFVQTDPPLYFWLTKRREQCEACFTTLHGQMHMSVIEAARPVDADVVQAWQAEVVAAAKRYNAGVLISTCKLDETRTEMLLSLGWKKYATQKWHLCQV